MQQEFMIQEVKPKEKRSTRWGGKERSVFIALAHQTRQEMLLTLKWKEMSFTELQELCKKYDNPKRTWNYHIQILSEFHLIAKRDNGLYWLTFRGLNVLKAMKEINESEMFI